MSNNTSDEYIIKLLSESESLTKDKKNWWESSLVFMTEEQRVALVQALEKERQFLIKHLQKKVDIKKRFAHKKVKALYEFAEKKIEEEEAVELEDLDNQLANL